MASVSIRMSTACAVFVGLLASSAHVVAGKEGFLGGASPRQLSSEEDFRNAMSAVMGCGGRAETERLSAVEKVLQPMWRVLPKNQNDLVEWRMVRYMAHRYFMSQSSLLIRGFEPMQKINASYLGAANILHEHVPSVVEKAIQVERTSNGFSLDDAVAMVATLEHLIVDAENTLLQTVYAQQRKSTKNTLSHSALSQLVESYMVHWMFDGDSEVVKSLLRKPALLHTQVPKWADIQGFVSGLIQSTQFARQRALKSGNAKAALTGQFSFEDAQEVVSAITKQFASFWENECQSIKHSLVAMDKTGTGRVTLSDFYGANADGEWRFGESEQYLRELGALDESSSWRGKQVILANYMQGANNCIAATSHYLVCCINECEDVLNDIEDSVGDPMAHPNEILLQVSNMTDLDDKLPKIDAALRTQLFRIADTHGGKVPLHGRLFAQWLHFVFPRECAFPHKAGVAASITPSQYSGESLASTEEVNTHADTRNDGSASFNGEIEQAHAMSQWSEEEELIADYSSHIGTPWGKMSTGLIMLAVLALVSSAGLAVVPSTKADKWGGGFSSFGMFGQQKEKAHFV